MLRSLLFAVASIVLHILVVTDGASASNEKLQVHLIMHSHDDPGWLKTADQYYTGANASVYLASVQYIFDSVVTELQKEPDRKFTFCEISFMSRWYYEQSAKMREQFKNLVKSGQITIVNGGWVMHDEAAAHYMSMIDQTTLGKCRTIDVKVFTYIHDIVLLRRPQVLEGRTELPTACGMANRPIWSLEHSRVAVLCGGIRLSVLWPHRLSGSRQKNVREEHGDGVEGLGLGC